MFSLSLIGLARPRLRISLPGTYSSCSKHYPVPSSISGRGRFRRWRWLLRRARSSCRIYRPSPISCRGLKQTHCLASVYPETRRPRLLLGSTTRLTPCSRTPKYGRGLPILVSRLPSRLPNIGSSSPTKRRNGRKSSGQPTSRLSDSRGSPTPRWFIGAILTRQPTVRFSPKANMTRTCLMSAFADSDIFVSQQPAPLFDQLMARDEHCS